MPLKSPLRVVFFAYRAALGVAVLRRHPRHLRIG